MRKILVLLGALVVCNLAVAGTYADALGSCLTDNATGKDRKDLTRWMFVALASNPVIHDLYNVPPAEAEKISRAAGAVFTRLLTETCAKEARAASKNEGSAAIEAAFGALGEVATNELASHPSVTAAMLQLDRYIDSKRVDKVLRGP